MSLADGPDGKSNGSYQFYGNNASYIELPNNGGVGVKRSITVLCWVNFSPNTSGPLFVFGSTHTLENFFGMYINGNKLFAEFKGQQLPSQQLWSNELKSNQWHYVGASYNHNTGNVTLWGNETRLAQKYFDSGQTVSTSHNVRMGSDWTDNSNFEGQITAMQVYNFSLTKEEIKAVKYVAVRGKNVNFKNSIPFLSSKNISTQPNDPARWIPEYYHLL